jgi:hypothetical protein
MNDLVPMAESRSVSPFDSDVSTFRGTLARRGENRQTLISWIREALVDGTDFGAIKRRDGTMTKPSLRKPGAEKICGMLGVVAAFPTLKDYEQLALTGQPIGQIILRCHLLSADGVVLADGVGARNLKQDSGDLNKCLKMCAKSAHIDATLRMAGLSEIFTQDLDSPQDLKEEAQRPDEQYTNHVDRAPVTPPRQHDMSTTMGPVSHPQSSHRKGFASDKQVKLISYRADNAQIPMLELLEHFKIPHINDIPFNQVNNILSWINGYHDNG